MAWPTEVRTEVLIKCGRHCCICHKFCGLKLELHHIKLKSEGGEDTADNCIPLCFDCHADQRSYDHNHPKGLKYSPEELKGHRDKWYLLVNQNLGTGTINHLEQDQKTFYIIFSAVPPFPTIQYLRGIDFNASKFSLNNLRPITSFLMKLENEPWIEFYDSDIESLKSTLVDLFIEFDQKITTDTFDFKDGTYDTQCVPREWLETQPKRYEETVDFLNKKSREIVTAYTDFIRLCRMKLGVIT